MTKLTSMNNIGGEMARKLTSVGIDSAERLTEVGAKQAFLLLKRAYPRVCLVHLYALEGAVCGTGIDGLSQAQKASLKTFSDGLKTELADS